MEVGFWPLGRGGGGSQLLAGRGSPLGNRPPFSALSRCYYPIRVRHTKARAQRSPGGVVQQPQRPRCSSATDPMQASPSLSSRRA